MRTLQALGAATALAMAPGCLEDDESNLSTTDVTECAHGIDNDENGLIDEDDPNCFGVEGVYDSEKLTEVIQACRNGEDVGARVADLPGASGL